MEGSGVSMTSMVTEAAPAAVASPPQPAPAAAARPKLSAAELAEFAGDYESPGYWARLEVAGDLLRGTFSGQYDALRDSLMADGLISTNAFSQKIQFTYFDLWHYYGRTAKHGAFMGGADFVQWHGYYEMVNKMVEIRHSARELQHGHVSAQPTSQPAEHS